MRTYRFLTMLHGRFTNWPGREVATNMRIRHVTSYLFRRHYGRSPDKHFWVTSASETMAEDRRGNGIQVEQVNWPGRCLPVRAIPCVCGRPPMVGLSTCETCYADQSARGQKEAA